MPRQSSYGDILRTARERKHLDLTTVARRLRIRTDILQAIEDADFAKMPPRGYTRNMINAYSRLVNLDPHEITELYLDEVYRYESGSPSSGNANSRSRSSLTTSGRPSQGSKKRRDRTNRNDVSSQRTTRMQRLNSAEPLQKRNTRSRGSRSQGNYETANRNNYQKYYSAPASTRRKITDLISPQILLLIVLIVVIIILVVAIVVAFGSGRQESEDIPDIPISGLTDTSDSSLQNTDISTEDAEPTAATVVYEVASGESSWIELYFDGSSTSEFEDEVEGPYTSEPISVSGTLLFKTANPTPVTLKVNDEEVELEYDGSEYYTYTVDFSAILAAWQTEHGITPEEDTSAEQQDTDEEENNSYGYYENTETNNDYDYDYDYDNVYDYDDDDYDYNYNYNYDYDDDDYDYDYDDDDDDDYDYSYYSGYEDEDEDEDYRNYSYYEDYDDEEDD